MTNDRIGMIYNFFILKKKNKKKSFSYLSHFSGFSFSKYDDVAQIRFCVRFLFSKYDDVA